MIQLVQQSDKNSVLNKCAPTEFAISDVTNSLGKGITYNSEYFSRKLTSFVQVSPTQMHLQGLLCFKVWDILTTNYPKYQTAPFSPKKYCNEKSPSLILPYKGHPLLFYKYTDNCQVPKPNENCKHW